MPPIETVQFPWEGRDIGLLSRGESPNSTIGDLARLQALNEKRASPEARFVSGSYWQRRPARPLEIIRLGTIAWWSYFFDILTASPETVAGPAGCTNVTKKTWLPSLLMVKFWDKPGGTEFI